MRSLLQGRTLLVSFSALTVALPRYVKYVAFRESFSDAQRCPYGGRITSPQFREAAYAITWFRIAITFCRLIPKPEISLRMFSVAAAHKVANMQGEYPR